MLKQHDKCQHGGRKRLPLILDVGGAELMSLPGLLDEIFASTYVLNLEPTHVVVVLLQVDELLLQGFDLALQVHAAHVGVIDELPQTDDVGLHGLADGQLRLKPAGQHSHPSAPSTIHIQL